MAHNFSINDNVLHQLQGPQGREMAQPRPVYTVLACLPVEADGRPQYRIKSQVESFERVVTEDLLSRFE
jgi:hypothetical protein